MPETKTPERTAGTSACRKIIRATPFRSVAVTAIAKRKTRLTIVNTKIIQVSRRRHRPKKCVEISDQTNARLTADAKNFVRKSSLRPARRTAVRPATTKKDPRRPALHRGTMG